MFQRNKLLASLVHSVLMLVDRMDVQSRQLKRMERLLTTQAEQIAALVASLADNFGKLDTAIQAVVAAKATATQADDPVLAGAIDALGKVNTAVQTDLAELTTNATQAAAAAGDGSTSQAAAAAGNGA